MIRSITLFSKWNTETDAFARVTVALAKGLLEVSSADISVACVLGRGCPPPEVPHGVRLILLEAERLRWAPVELARHLRKDKPDALIAMPSTAAVVAFLASRLAAGGHTKFVVNQGDTLFSEIHLDHRRDPGMRLLSWLARLVYPRADGLVTTTTEVMEIMRQHDIKHRHSVVIPNPVDLTIIDQEAATTMAGDHSLISGEMPNIVSLGRLVKRKNFDLLLAAGHELQKRGRRSRLIIIGDGPERSHLQKRISELGIDAKLAGYVENAWALVSRSDVFAMSSEDEAFCLALAEAMACRVPVVATDAVGGGPRVLLLDGELGTLVPRNDPIALADALADALELGEERDKQTELARASLSRFQPAVVASQWLDFLSSL